MQPARPDLARIADRLEIEDLLAQYTFAVDGRDWAALDGVFTPDATIDYTATGGTAGSFPEVKAWLADALQVAESMQHLLGQIHVDLSAVAGEEGDVAPVRAYFWNPMRIVLPSEEAGAEPAVLEMLLGGEYQHEMVRTEHGWRSRSLTEHVHYRRMGPG